MIRYASVHNLRGKPQKQCEQTRPFHPLIHPQVCRSIVSFQREGGRDQLFWIINKSQDRPTTGACSANRPASLLAREPLARLPGRGAEPANSLARSLAINPFHPHAARSPTPILSCSVVRSSRPFFLPAARSGTDSIWGPLDAHAAPPTISISVTTSGRAKKRKKEGHAGSQISTRMKHSCTFLRTIKELTRP